MAPALTTQIDANSPSSTGDTCSSVSTFPLADAPVALIGQAGAWFAIEKDEDAILVTPRQSLPCRCTIRVAALFEQDRGFFDANTVMGRLNFPRGATETQRYVPYTHDPQRSLRELFLPVETMPEDDWPVSVGRWRNYQAIAKRLLASAGVSWGGLIPEEIDALVANVVWPEPLEGCLLHALVQRFHSVGDCVVEIGSFRGRSATALAMGLAGVSSPAKIVSIDPHLEHPHNVDHVRIALAQIGEGDRLVQFRGTSGEAHKLIRPESASLVFVDGDHSYEQVVADFENYRGIVAPGGCLVFHDYGYGDHNRREEADPGVRRAVDQHVMTANDFTPLLLGHTQFAFTKRG